MKNPFKFKEMKKLKNILSSFMAILMLLTTSCDDLTEINTSSNQLNASDIDVKYVLTSVLSASGYCYIRKDVYGSSTGLPEAIQYLQRDYIDWQSPNTFVWSPKDFSTYYAPIGDDYCSPLVNSQYIYDNAQYEALEDNQKFYTAVGQIMRSFWYGHFTSLYGDIPYSEAMKASDGNYTPVYDNQKDIFVGILDDLKSANELLSGVSSVDGASSADLMFGGDVLKWRKFANSLRLRFLLRLSEKLSEMSSAGVDVKTEFSTIVGNSTTYPVLASNDDNAFIPYVGSTSDNSWYGGPLNWTNRSEFYRRKPCATFVDELRESSDPRLTTFIRPVDAQLKISDETPTYQMLSDGQIIRNVPSSTSGIEDINTYRYVGLPPAMQDPNLYNLASSTDFNAISSLNPDIYVDLAANSHVSYLADIYAENSNSLVNAVFMSYAELNFILAEARMKGWISTNTTVGYLKTAVASSLAQYDISDGSLTVYDQTTDEIIAFDESAFLENLENEFEDATSDTEKLTLLMTQKWLACFMTPEFWFDWRRTGVPDFGSNLIAASNGSKIPVRYIYGDEEKILNETNVTDAITRLDPATDDQWSKMWLLQGTDNPW